MLLVLILLIILCWRKNIACEFSWNHFKCIEEIHCCLQPHIYSTKPQNQICIQLKSSEISKTWIPEQRTSPQAGEHERPLPSSRPSHAAGEIWSVCGDWGVADIDINIMISWYHDFLKKMYKWRRSRPLGGEVENCVVIEVLMLSKKYIF